MTLAPGSKLGPYEIVAPLGAGGMGEVYRARDTRLERTVAIKILPAHLSANSEAKQRFEREGRSISSLSHPNICHLYDVGDQEGLDYIVMEYLEGETLADRLKKGPLPLDQLLRCGIEIAEGLDKAHRCGVIHRDLKPGNIMLTKTGAKLMDFGLAKSAAVSAANEPASALTQSLSPTLASPNAALTAQGMVLGTFQYMSPEQVEGKEADARSDIFSLGTVLYEMATGKRAFEGKTGASAMAAVLDREPTPISSVQPMSPPALDLVVKTCLAKDPDQRFQSAHDVGLQLRWLAQSSQTAALAVSLPRRSLRWMVAALLIVSALAFGIGAGFWLRTPSLRGATVLGTVPAPVKVRYDFTGNFAGPAVVSHDGSNLAFSATDESGIRTLWVRNLATGAEQSLSGTTNATFPFWSPDGAALGFFSDGKLRTIRLSGGETTVLADAPIGRGGAWSSGGTIVFAPNFQTGLSRVSAFGGAVQPATALDSSVPSTHRWPCFLPDGRHFLYLAAIHTAPRSAENAIYIASLDGGAPRLLVHTISNPVYASGYLLYLRDDNLLAQKLDAGKLVLTGEPVILARNVTFDLSIWRGVYSASQNGVLVYQSGNTAGDTLLTGYDRTGKVLGTVGTAALHQSFRISPDGKRLVVAEGYPKTNLWIYELDRDVRKRLTLGVDDEDISPVWSPDGQWIAFARFHATGYFDLYRKRSDGSGTDELLLSSSGDKMPVRDKLPVSWSPDGRFLLYIEGVRGAGYIMALPLFGERKPLPVSDTGVDKYKAQFSPDGRWIAYQSVETMFPQINVTSFPKHSGDWQVSTSGGADSHWNSNGKELFFLSENGGHMMAMEVGLTQPSFQMGASHVLFSAHAYQSFYFTAFDISPGGQRFLLNTTLQTESAPLTVLVNWTPEPKR